MSDPEADDDLTRAWAELALLARNDTAGALAWRTRWLHVLPVDDGLGSTLLRLFDDPDGFLARLP